MKIQQLFCLTFSSESDLIMSTVAHNMKVVIDEALSKQTSLHARTCRHFVPERVRDPQNMAHEMATARRVDPKYENCK
jgi:hypothetical protein